MKNMIFSSLLVSVFLTAAPIGAATSEPASAEVRIPFVSHGVLNDFRVVDRDTVLIRATGRQWYRAELLGPCIDLPWAHAIGVDARGTDALDRFSTFIVRGQRCPLTSLTKIASPDQQRPKVRAGNI